MLSFPPHCTHNLQPLDVGVNGSFKTFCAKAQENWLRNNPGKTMSIYEIPGIVKHAWPLAATPNNIMNAFNKAGISPYNPEIFTDEDFAPSFVTDRPMPDTNISNMESQLQELSDLKSLRWIIIWKPSQLTNHFQQQQDRRPMNLNQDPRTLLICHL